MITVEIYWNDLTKEKQLELLGIFGDNNNWDVFPMATIEVEDSTYDK